MEIIFYKYQGTGNDFIIIDNRLNQFKKDNTDLIAKLCNRRFGIGADGLILLEEDADTDFKMIYFNADGNKGSMCGNGSRCTVAFAHQLGIIKDKCKFMAYDGIHIAEITDVLDDNLFNIKVSMQNVSEIEIAEHVFLNTGSPHFVCFVDDLNDVDVIASGRAIRYDEKFKGEGTNVNFVTVKNKHIEIRTYERGVEDETLSCGTGVTASAIAVAAKNLIKVEGTVLVKSRGGNLKVYFNKKADTYADIYLEGPAEKVFSGTVNLSTVKFGVHYA